MNYFEDEEPYFVYNDTLDGATDIKARQMPFYGYNDSQPFLSVKLI